MHKHTKAMFCVLLVLSAGVVAVYVFVVRAPLPTHVPRDTTAELRLGCTCCPGANQYSIRLPGGPAMLAYSECGAHMCAKWNVAHARIMWINVIEQAIRANPAIRTIYVEDHADRHCPYILALFTRRVLCDHVSPQTSSATIRRLLQSRFPAYIQLE